MSEIKVGENETLESALRRFKKYNICDIASGNTNGVTLEDDKVI